MTQISTQPRGPAQRRRPWRSRRRRPGLTVLAAIAAGGALGAPARYAVGRLVPVAPGQFPWPTLAVNLTGCIVLGALLALLLERSPPHHHLRPFVATGFLGAYTTYSTFAVETVLLIRDGRPVAGVVYAVASGVGGLAAAWAGMRVGRELCSGDA